MAEGGVSRRGLLLGTLAALVSPKLPIKAIKTEWGPDVDYAFLYPKTLSPISLPPVTMQYMGTRDARVMEFFKEWMKMVRQPIMSVEAHTDMQFCADYSSEISRQIDNDFMESLPPNIEGTFNMIEKVTNIKEHAAALARMDTIIDAKVGTPEMVELVQLGDLIEAYETATITLAQPTQEDIAEFKKEQGIVDI
jgi:hypothetical protein